MAEMRRVTMKFGGTSMMEMPTIAQILQEARARGEQVIAVVSALAGVTDALERSLAAAAKGERWLYLTECGRLRDRHLELAQSLITDAESLEPLLLELNERCDAYLQICDAVHILGEATPRIQASAISYGERLSAPVLAALLCQNGWRARAISTNGGDDPTSQAPLIQTDGEYLNANPLWSSTESQLKKIVLPLLEEGITPILTGFIGATAAGHTTTLGRGGSDFSAAIVARCCNCQELIVWTDVDGVMSVDPRLDDRAQLLEMISYSEVSQLAYLGARVLHPRTVQPVVEANIPTRVCNTFRPDGRGTLILPESEPPKTAIRAVTSISHVAMVTVSGRGMQGVPGIVGRAFLAAAKTGTSILMISQSSSEQNFCFLVNEESGDRAKRAVEAEFAAEMARGDVEHVQLDDDVAIVTVVGAGMQHTPGVAGQIFTVLGQARINVLSISQGSSECSISFVVKEGELARAVRAIHDLVLVVNGREGTRTPDLTDVNRAL